MCALDNKDYDKARKTIVVFVVPVWRWCMIIMIISSLMIVCQAMLNIPTTVTKIAEGGPNTPESANNLDRHLGARAKINPTVTKSKIASREN